jgi:spore maturation protein CgeB
MSAAARLLFCSSLDRSPLNRHIADAIAAAFEADPRVEATRASLDELAERDSLADIDLVVYAGSSLAEDVPLESVAALARKDGATSAFWATDDPYEFDTRHRALEFDFYFSNDRNAADSFLERDRVHHLPLAACAATDRHEVAALEAREIGLFFCGVPYRNRTLIVDDLMAHPDLNQAHLLIAGPDWHRPGLPTMPGASSHAELIELYADSAFVLDIGRTYSLANSHWKLMATTPGPRSFECACAGAPQIHFRMSHEIEDYFVPGREIICVESVDEAVDAFHWYRANPEAWLRLAQRAQARVLCEHLYEHRVATLLDTLADAGVDGVARQEPRRAAAAN